MSDFVNSENQDSAYYRFKPNIPHQLNPFTTIVTFPLNGMGIGLHLGLKNIT
jgi:hypothetical protein